MLYKIISLIFIDIFIKTYMKLKLLINSVVKYTSGMLEPVGGKLSDSEMEALSPDGAKNI